MGRRGGGRREGQKDKRLCAQVRDALSFSFADIDDDVILSLSVVDVVPAPDTTRVAVHVYAPPGSDLEEMHARLERFMGRFRADVASAINRKKTPSLVFVFVVPPTPEAPPLPQREGT